MTSTLAALTHADVDKIMRLVELLHRSGLQFIQIETDGVEICISKDGAAIAGVSASSGTSPALPISSPSVGIFHSPENGEQIALGSLIDAQTILGSVHTLDEVSPVCADTAGSILEICINDGEFVEFGQPLYRIIPISGA